MSILDRGQRPTRLAALCATGVLICALAAALPAPGGASAPPPASAAKKKCKKGFVKKKVKTKTGKKKKTKCVKKPTPAPAPGSLVRATLTWSANADLDLLAWDPSGAKGSVEASAIASASFSAEDTDGGTETFTDLQPSSWRQFTYGICADSVSTPTTWSLTLVFAYGRQLYLRGTETNSSPGYVSFTATGQNLRRIFVNPDSFDPGPGSTNGWCPT